MTAPKRNTHVFIVRIWHEPREIPGAALEWRGVVEYVPHGERIYFRDFAHLVSFLSSKSEVPLHDVPPSGRLSGLARRVWARMGISKKP